MFTRGSDCCWQLGCRQMRLRPQGLGVSGVALGEKPSGSRLPLQCSCKDPLPFPLVPPHPPLPLPGPPAHLAGRCIVPWKQAASPRLSLAADGCLCPSRLVGSHFCYGWFWVGLVRSQCCQPHAGCPGLDLPFSPLNLDPIVQVQGSWTQTGLSLPSGPLMPRTPLSPV